MLSQKSYQDKVASLYLVATPIGNYEDMTYRSVEILKSVSYIFSEDTRVTKQLLSHFNINTPLMSYHSFNEETQSDKILELLSLGNNIALVTDAGLPGISDPGFLVSKKVIENGFNVISLPGASAGITALIASGLPCDKFYFYGFLNRKSSQRVKEIEKFKSYTCSIILHEAPHRIKETIIDLYNVLGDRKVVIARELTKKYEEYIRTTLKEAKDIIEELKGEIVLILEGSNQKNTKNELNDLSIIDHYNYYLSKNMSEKEAMKEVAKDLNVSKSDIYKEIIGEKK